jgi:hypothetical protein
MLGLREIFIESRSSFASTICAPEVLWRVPLDREFAPLCLQGHKMFKRTWFLGHSKCVYIFHACSYGRQS